MSSAETSIFDGVDRRKLAEASLRSITLSTARVRGDEFFRVLVRDLAAALDMFYVIAGEIVAENGEESNRTLAVWAGNDYMANMTYSLRHTPCRNVADQSMCYHPDHIQTEYPLDLLLVDMNAESYIGMPMVSTEGKTLGILVALDVKPMDENKRLLALSLLSIFSARCAAELQNQQRESELEALVEKRTRALENARDMLVQREKLAALGSLVAGVAHAMNTPVGNALITASSVGDSARELSALVAESKISKVALLDFASRFASGAELIERNLGRASELITNFRMLADSQDNDAPAELILLDYINGIGIAHQPELRKHNAQIVTAIPKDMTVSLSPGSLSQIVSNLIMNALTHGFHGRTAGTISISAHTDGANSSDLLLAFSDDGVGATPEVCRRILEPFFTTRMGQGSGLGMHVTYTLVQRLGGRIEVTSPARSGLQVEIVLPGVICL